MNGGGLTTKATIGVVFACLSGVALLTVAVVLFIYKRRGSLSSCRPPCMRRQDSETESTSEITATQEHVTDETFVSAPPGYYEVVGSQELPPAYDNIFKNILTTPAGALQPELNSYASSATLNTSIAGVSIIGAPPDYSTEDPLGRYGDNRNHISGLTLSSEQLTGLSHDDVTADEVSDSPRTRSGSSSRIRQMQVTGCILTGHLLPQHTEQSRDDTNGVSSSARPINVSLVLDNQVPQITVIERDENDTESDPAKIKDSTTTRELSPSSEAGIQNEAFDESDDKTEDQHSPEVLNNPMPRVTVIERDEHDTAATSGASSSHTADHVTREDPNKAGIENKAFVDSDESHNSSES